MITAKLLREWGACWDDQRIAAPLGDRKEVTPRDIADDNSISLDERLWVLGRTLWYLDENAARGFAIESASLVAHLAGDEDDQALYLGLLNEMLQIEDLPEGQRAAAWYAARDAELQKAIERAIEWLGDYADGWEGV